MNNLTDLWENRVMDWLNPAVDAPDRPTGPLRVAIFITMPTSDDGTGGTEVTGGGYARTDVVFAEAASGMTSNTLPVTFAEALDDWGLCEGIGIYEDGGTLMWTGTFPAPKTILSGQTFRINSGTLVLEFD